MNDDSLVLVTGGSGYVGGHLTGRLLRDGYRVRATVRDASKAAEVRSLTAAAGVDPSGRLEIVTASLDDDEAWADAVDGVSFVHHVASPFPRAQPENDDEIIVPARNGALRVLRAARDAGVRRTVLTSSFAAVGYSPKPGGSYNENDWTDPSDDNPPYIRSKAIAERAAWDLIRERPAGMELTVVNPTGIFGPVLSSRLSSSVVLVKMMLTGDLPVLPAAHFAVADVRDVAEAHVRAMLEPKAAGERFLVTSGEVVSWLQVAQILRGSDAIDEAIRKNIPAVEADGDETRPAPVISNEKARSVLGMTFRPAATTLIDTALSLAELGQAGRGRLAGEWPARRSTLATTSASGTVVSIS